MQSVYSPVRNASHLSGPVVCDSEFDEAMADWRSQERRLSWLSAALYLVAGALFFFTLGVASTALL